jgi:hypothetical protein
MRATSTFPPESGAAVVWGWIAGRLYTEHMHTTPEYIGLARRN